MSKQGRNRDRRQKGGPKRRRGGPKWEDKKVKSRSRKRKDERQTRFGDGGRTRRIWGR